jgi:CxxC-x17-CxxC domain-containing protein
MSREPRQTWPATCWACGEQCRVPFKPQLDPPRPVYCRDCLREIRGEKEAHK